MRILLGLSALTLSGQVFAVPREQALDNASQYGTHVWTSTSANETASCSSDYESDYAPGTYVGLPYDWGGYMTLEEFDAEIADGYGAGSHSWHGVLECTAGVDCSGFVSMVWETGHYSTSTIPGVATAIEWDAIERADVVNDAGSHVVLFTHISQDGWPVFWEASGSASKVRLNSQSGWSYLDGYQPYRFDGIEDGGSSGTVENPKLIEAFPYTDYGWTAGATSDTFDVYSCSDADESGPEVLYRATIPGPGTVTAVVSDADGVDIDVHVLTASDAGSCVGRDDVEVTAHVEGTTFWLALDTYVGSTEQSGPYVVTVDFLADDEPAPDDTGEPDPSDSGPYTGPLAPGEMVRFDSLGGCGCAAPLTSGTGASGSGASSSGTLAAGGMGLLLIAGRRRALRT